jgi:hypothetical protein
MTRFIISFLLILSLFAGSCSSRKNKVNRKNMIPEKEFVTILTELYLSDGLLLIPKVTQMYTVTDTLAAHLDVLKMHGYTKENMDNTLMYYYFKNPKKLIKIYDQVLGVLSEMQSRYEKEVNQMQAHTENLWKGEIIYLLPDFSGNDSANLVLKANIQGSYYLTFTATLAPVDQSYKTRPALYTCHPDSINTGKRHYIKTLEYIKDGQPHEYELEIKIVEKSDYYIRGWFYDSESCPDPSGGNLRIEKISLTFIPGLV